MDLRPNDIDQVSGSAGRSESPYNTGWTIVGIYGTIAIATGVDNQHEAGTQSQRSNRIQPGHPKLLIFVLYRRRPTAYPKKQSHLLPGRLVILTKRFGWARKNHDCRIGPGVTGVSNNSFPGA
jgi:hypothetical protein